MTPPAVGAIAKVLLPGESPWAECVAVEPDGSWQGRIVNWLVGQDPKLRQALVDRDWGGGEPLPQLHDFKQDQIVRFRATHYGWEPAERPGGTA